MPRYHQLAELAPRDVVARSILSEMLSEGTDCQYLDLRHLPADRVHARFPTISAICRKYGLDLAGDLVPVAPAAHYCMGGVMTDSLGRTTLAGLYAVGEVACTGVHGANRLASNSLLEGLVFGLRLAGGLAGVLAEQDVPSRRGEGGEEWLGKKDTGYLYKALWSPGDPPVYDDPSWEEALLRVELDHESMLQTRRDLRQVMWQYVSLRRDRQGLLEARNQLHELRNTILAKATAKQNEQQFTIAWLETINMLKAAELVIAAALQRRESRGSHWRLDYNTPDETLAGRHYVFQPIHHAQSLHRGGSGEDVERGCLHRPGAWLAEDDREEVPSHA